MRTDLNQMAIFASVVKHGSFTAAALALAMPKSTVSKRVAELEDRLGTRLLQRTTRSVQLTHAGSVYYEQCQRIIQEAEAAERLLTEHDGPLAGSWRGPLSDT
jgi:LysR family transcriptional regulator, regulator for bpeEF and oprC